MSPDPSAPLATNATSDETGIDVSRRGFLKGLGAIVAVPASFPVIATTAIAAEQVDDGLKRFGPDAAPLRLNINGKPRELSLEPRTTLLEVLRDKLDMTGAKEICSRGSCGGCTVFIDGKPVNSCLMLAVDAVGAEITTVEGLAENGKLSTVQQAFATHDALQCGYCTPGFVMSVTALVKQNPTPTSDDVRRACSGNICRCGTYPKIFEAALTAAGIKTSAGNEADNGTKALENTRGRVDAPLKVTGAAKYTADVNRPNQAYAAILPCPFGRAKIKSCDIKAAESVKGVLRVHINKDAKFAYCGQSVGDICAETPQALDDAIAALKLRWDIESPTTDPLAAHNEKHGAFPLPIDKAGKPDDRKKVEDAFAAASKLVEQTYQTQIQTHSCLEPHCAVADVRPESAEIWVSSQGTGTVLDGAANVLGLKKSAVTAHCEFVGGGFGSKFGIDAEGDLAAKLSKELGRPVKVVNDRKREQLDTGCRPGAIQYMKAAIGPDGLPTGGHVYVAGYAGAGGGSDVPNPSRYRFGPTVRASNHVDLTAGGARAMRAPGHPQAMFAVDSFVDELAAAAGIDPLDYRRKIDGNETRRKMYDLGAERIGWASRPRPDGAGDGRIRRGIGIGVGDWGNSQGNGQIRVDVFKDGTVKVLSGTQDIGTGNRTLLADVLADQLKIDRSLITADCGRSDFPPGPASGGSVTARFITPAIREAGAKAMEKLAEVAGRAPKNEEEWRAACKRIEGESFSVIGDANNTAYFGKGSSEGVQFAEVEVDTHTGFIRVKKVIAIQACGLPVNRLTVENQIIGGVIQGVSFALYEEKLLDPTTGAMLNPDLEHYKIMGPADCPEITPIIWREGDDLGVRALGEPPVIPTAGAVANAVANALGVRIRSLPITPAKVLAALKTKRGA